MKRKKHKLYRTRSYSPIIAVIGGPSYCDNLPIDYGQVNPNNGKKVKPYVKALKSPIFKKKIVRSKNNEY